MIVPTQDFIMWVNCGRFSLAILDGVHLDLLYYVHPICS